MGKKSLPVTAIDRSTAIAAWKKENGVSKKTRGKHAKFIAHFHKLNKTADEEEATKVGSFSCLPQMDACILIVLDGRISCISRILKGGRE